MKMQTAIQMGRTPWIDIYKGFAILLVVFGHLRIAEGIYRFIYMFHMYAFFFIAGVTYRNRPEESVWKYIYSSVKRLYIPYLFYAFAWDVTELVMRAFLGTAVEFSFETVGLNVLSVLIGGDSFPSTASVGPAWFLCALLSVRVIYSLVSRISKNNSYIYIYIYISERFPYSRLCWHMFCKGRLFFRFA